MPPGGGQPLAHGLLANSHNLRSLGLQMTSAQQGSGLPAFLGTSRQYVRQKGESRRDILSHFRSQSWCYNSSRPRFFNPYRDCACALRALNRARRGAYSFGSGGRGVTIYIRHHRANAEREVTRLQ